MHIASTLKKLTHTVLGVFTFIINMLCTSILNSTSVNTVYLFTMFCSCTAILCLFGARWSVEKVIPF